MIKKKSFKEIFDNKEKKKGPYSLILLADPLCSYKIIHCFTLLLITDFGIHFFFNRSTKKTYKLNVQSLIKNP